MLTSLGSTEPEILTAWALRFDGYRYMKETGFERPDDYVIRMGTPGWNFAPLEELAIFFVHQRLVMKWSASRPDGRSEWQFLRQIFLHVYDQEIPEKWRVEPYYEDWERHHAPHAELEREVILQRYQAFRT